MKLNIYLLLASVDAKAFAARIGVSEKAVRHWLNGARTPRPGLMAKIKAETRGAVTPNDFMAPEEQEAAE